MLWAPLSRTFRARPGRNAGRRWIDPKGDPFFSITPGVRFAVEYFPFLCLGPGGLGEQRPPARYCFLGLHYVPVWGGLGRTQATEGGKRLEFQEMREEGASDRIFITSRARRLKRSRPKRRRKVCQQCVRLVLERDLKASPVRRPNSQSIRQIWSDLPPGARVRMPRDGASQVHSPPPPRSRPRYSLPYPACFAKVDFAIERNCLICARGHVRHFDGAGRPCSRAARMPSGKGNTEPRHSKTQQSG